VAAKRGFGPIVVVLAAVLMTGSACSDKPADQAAPKVATLTSPSSGPASAAAGKPERPRYRLDTTAEEEEVMLRPYYKCIDEKVGFDYQHMSKKPPPAAMKKLANAKQTCSSELPLPAWEEDPANPEAKDFARDVVKCLKGKGADNAHVGSDGIGIEYDGGYDERQSISKTMDMVPGCQREVAAKNKD
jgi:hypothetical protein